MQPAIKSSMATTLYTCGKRPEGFPFITLGVELMQNDSANRCFLKSLSNVKT